MVLKKQLIKLQNDKKNVFHKNLNENKKKKSFNLQQT